MSAEFRHRHIGLGDSDRAKILASLGYGSLDQLIERVLPPSVRTEQPSTLGPANSEAEVIEELRGIAAKNQLRDCLIGQGFYGTFLPAVIKRNVLENPAWYTSYTPYQAEISQGRLEALLLFQTMVSDLTGLAISNASLLDEPTAAAEAMALAFRVSKSKSRVFLVDSDTHPQTLAVLATRAEPLGVQLVEFTGADAGVESIRDGCFGVLVSYPSSLGRIQEFGDFATAAHEHEALVIACTDLLALTLIVPPGEWGADVAVGSAQRLGVPMGAGGPHPGFMAVRNGLERAIPGRIVGVSRDSQGQLAYRLALQTREQHIRRERATSNICTAQVLPALLSAFYAAYHGPDGLREIAAGIHNQAVGLARALSDCGLTVGAEPFFDTIVVAAPTAQQLWKTLGDAGIDVRLAGPDQLSISVDETTTAEQLETLVGIMAAAAQMPPACTRRLPWHRRTSTSSQNSPIGGSRLTANGTGRWEAPGLELPTAVRRESKYLTHECFNRYHTETEMLRWLRRLADADFALDRGMIPLGSCTMKLNPTTAMEPISWPEFANMHPFAPIERLGGYLELVDKLQHWLAELTGYDAVSIQPNAGSQGELAGLLAIRAYHRDRGQIERDVCLIPTSAHGTNAASAAMAGMRVVVVECDKSGGVDLEDLKAKLGAYGARLAAAMITYPSTYGVYDDTVTQVCELIHEAGGQVYVDGANFNALLGISAPGLFGADVSHLNLHKTFTVPHGGGGPGVGPVAVRAHLAPYLPHHPLDPTRQPDVGTSVTGPVSGTPWGNAGVLPISYAYLRLMGEPGLRSATENAVLAANYLAAKLHPFYPVLYRGRAGLVAHECILDLRPLTKASGVTAEDVAKRLIDYGFHAPTLSFPVSGTLMVEPTESESLAELDRFCDALIAIRSEIEQILSGELAVAESPLRQAPHPASSLVAEWNRPYSKAQAVYPMPGQHRTKYWPPVSRIDAAAGDRNLVCACPPPESFSPV